MSSAQGLYIPQPSPKAAIEQTIGVCSVRLEYSRPSARDREIFGELVPHGEVWRAGANAATVLATDQDIQFGCRLLPAGRYALMMIPTAESWIIIVNSEWEQWGAFNYDPSEDVFRFTVDPIESGHTEMCTYAFERVDKTSALLILEWSTVRIEMPIAVDTRAQTIANIESMTGKMRSEWYTFSNAANYYFYELNRVEEAIEYVNVAIALDAPNPSPWMLKSQILASLERYEEAIALAEEAIEISKRTDHAFEIGENERQIKKWRGKL